MSIAIIGAGIAGLMTAYTLRSDTVIFEKSRGLTGRAATRWYDRPGGRVYVDHGAQHLKPETSRLSDLMVKTLPTANLTNISPPIWTFDTQNAIHEGDPQHNQVPRFTYRQGVATLGRLLADAAALTIKTQVQIEQLRLEPSGVFILIDSDGNTIGSFEQVIVATPAAQAADILAASQLPPTERQHLETILRSAVYRRCLSITLGFDRPLLPRSFCALRNSDRAHPISWIGVEHSKPGHVPANAGVLVAQMVGSYSLTHWDDPHEQIIADVAQQTSQVFGEDLTTPDWTDLQKWRYSQPDQLVEAGQLNQVIRGLWFAGDYLRGGRVHLAADTGYEVARAIHAASE